MFDWFHGLTGYFVSEDLASWKKARKIYTHMLDLTFSRDNM